MVHCALWHLFVEHNAKERIIFLFIIVFLFFLKWDLTMWKNFKVMACIVGCIGGAWYWSQGTWSKTVQLHRYLGAVWLHTWLVARCKVCSYIHVYFGPILVWAKLVYFVSGCGGKDWFTAEPLHNGSMSTITTLTQKFLFPRHLKKMAHLLSWHLYPSYIHPLVIFILFCIQTA